MLIEKTKSVFARIFQKDNVRSIAICVAVIGFCWFAIFGDQGLYRLHKSKILKKQTAEEIIKLKNSIDGLKRQRELLNDPKHLELVIRQELGYVKPGETVYQQMSP